MFASPSAAHVAAVLPAVAADALPAVSAAQMTEVDRLATDVFGILLPDRIHILKKGRVRVYRVTPDGKQLTLDIHDKGTILGDMSLLGQDPIPEAFAETLDEAVICTISPDELCTLVERYPTVGVNTISYLSRRLRDAESELGSMAYQRVGQRLARKLVDLSQRFGVKTSRGTLIEARLTQQELAEMIGTTRETLAHTLADFRKRGLLDTEKHRVLVRDAEQLVDIAEGLHELDDAPR